VDARKRRKFWIGVIAAVVLTPSLLLLLAPKAGPRLKLRFVPPDSLVYQREVLFSPNFASIFSFKANIVDVRIDMEREMRALHAQKLGEDMWRLSDGTLIDMFRFGTVSSKGVRQIIADRSYVTLYVRHKESVGPFATIVRRLRGQTNDLP
jgi:hypothetical protein